MVIDVLKKIIPVARVSRLMGISRYLLYYRKFE